LLAQVLSQVNQILETDLAPSTFYEYPTISSLAKQLIKTHEPNLYNSLFNFGCKKEIEPVGVEENTTTSISTEKLKSNYYSNKTNNSVDIAVVGLSCRLPGAEDLDQYWKLLSEGRSAINKVPHSRWGFESDYYAGLLDNISYFDPQFFYINEEDARKMDPQALMLLEETLKLFYQAGYNHKEMKGKAVGVYIGARSNKSDIMDMEKTHNPVMVLGQNYLAANISNYFDLSGPSLVVDTACSSSLVGMNMAIQALQCGDIEAAIVGGISLLVDDDAHKLFKRRGILNPSESFHIFDGRANGIVLSEGVGMVLLKPLDKAILDGDHIYSVIKGVAVNNDGRTAGPATPNIQRQKDVMEAALLKSGRNASEVQYIEANGSGSEVTDLLELKSIQSVYGGEGQFHLEIGSMKPNIGHPLCAEGIASFIKTVLMIYKKQFVPFISGEQPMKHFDINASRFHFNKKLTDWDYITRIAAINCFGDGGTNCHIILESFNHINLGKSKRNPIEAPKLNKQNMKQINLSLDEIQEQSLQENLVKKRKMIWQSFQ
jgi:acyl transferase domain-containing protein